MNGEQYLEVVRERLSYLKRLADEATRQLSPAELRFATDSEANSVAITMKHVGGNLISRFTDFLTTDGEKPDRNRDGEFVLGASEGDETIRALWERGWGILDASLSELTDADMGRTVTIRGEPHSVVQAIERSLAHCAYHVGQIVQLARQQRGSAWRSLSIPRGGSESFNESMEEKHGS